MGGQDFAQWHGNYPMLQHTVEIKAMAEETAEGPWQTASKWYLDHRLWLEAFVLVNLAFLSLDIYLAHSVNQFRHEAEYVPLYFSLAAPAVLARGPAGRGMAGLRGRVARPGLSGRLVAVGIGLVGVVLHLDSRFFHERTLKSLVYAAPFAAPLAYTGLGLLLVMNRMVDAIRRSGRTGCC